SGGKSGSETQGAMSSSGSQVEHCHVNVAMKAGESEMPEDEEELNISPTVEATPKAGTTRREVEKRAIAAADFGPGKTKFNSLK
ncbi:unnamed protein product, partial [Ectocarpus fasciculatus]